MILKTIFLLISVVNRESRPVGRSGLQSVLALFLKGLEAPVPPYSHCQASLRCQRAVEKPSQHC